jgi:hypothetical protein
VTESDRGAWWRRLSASRWGLITLLIGLGVLDYGVAKGLRALRDRSDRVDREAPARVRGTELSAASPVTVEVPASAGAGRGADGVPLPAGVSVFVAPSLIDRIELAGEAGRTSVDPFGVPDSADPGLPVPQANRGALIARLDDDPPFAIGSRACIFTATRRGRLRFGVNDPNRASSGGSFSVTLSIPELRSVLAATPACGTVLE